MERSSRLGVRSSPAWASRSIPDMDQNSEVGSAARRRSYSKVDGQVAFNDNLTDDNSNWTAAAPNQPFSVGDRIYTRENSRTSLAFSGRNFARLDPNTAPRLCESERQPHPTRVAGRHRRFSMSGICLRAVCLKLEHRMARSIFRNRVFTK